MRILALDPGEKVGWARTEVDAKGKTSELVHGISTLKDMAMRLSIAFDGYDVVVCETFIVPPGSRLTGSFPTVQFIGMVRLLSWQTPKVDMIWQAPRVMHTAAKTIQKLKPSWAEIINQGGAHDDTHDYSAILHLWHHIWLTRITSMEAQ